MHMQVDSCKQKYRKTVGWWRWLLGSDRESYLFSEISKGSKPRSRRVSELMTALLFVCSGYVLLFAECGLYSCSVHCRCGPW